MSEKESIFKFGKTSKEAILKKEIDWTHSKSSEEKEALSIREWNKTQKKIAEAEKILAKKEEVSPKERAKLINHYIETNYLQFCTFPNNEKKRETTKDYFMGLTPENLEKILGKQESALIFHIITEQNRLLQLTKENNININLVRNFAKQEGDGMLPCRIRKALFCLGAFQNDLINSLLTETCDFYRIYRVGDSQFLEEFLKNVIHPLMRDLKISLVDLERESQKWQEYQKFDPEEKEKPIKIFGFEIFDFSEIKGEEIIARAAKVLPRELLSTNVKEVDYHDELKPMDKKEYGFEGEGVATFTIDSEEEESRVTFNKVSNSTGVNYLRRVPRVIAHELAGHGLLDSRITNQIKLTPEDQLQMIVWWLRVEAEENEWSSYVLKINNRDKRKEKTLKSIEGLADSIAYYLTDPEGFQDLCPQRYEFLTYWFKKLFPDFNLGNSLRAKMNYDILMERLEKEEEEELRKNFKEFLKRIKEN